MTHDPTAAPSGGQLHLWRIHLDQPPELVTGLRGLLEQPELARADRFIRRRHGRRFTVARAAMRQILGAALGVAPAAVVFAYGEHGKPRLAEAHAGSGLAFNLSHSAELGLLGVVRGREIGVDVEQRRRIERAMKIADRFFSAAEKEALHALPPEQHHAAFLRCWTCKEAYIKAIGEGLSRPLATFDVAFAGGEDERSLLRVEGRPDEVDRWRFRAVDAGADFVATVAVDGPVGELVVRDHVFA